MSDEDVVAEEVAEEAPVVEEAPDPKPKKDKAAKNPDEDLPVFYGVDPMYQHTSVVKRARRPE